jgi:dTDP-D-glucose 4,6-dehydratase
MRKSMSTKRMKEFLNVEITDFDIALQETVDWFLEKVKNEQPISNS